MMKELLKGSTVTEPVKQLPVTAVYDVVVSGGGIAGCAAAVAAARNGASVCLIEKMFGLGGLATLGNVTIWLPICDGTGRQVMAGIPEEMLRLSVADLKEDNKTAFFTKVPACWEDGGDPEERKQERFKTRFNPGAYMFGLEKWVLDAGVLLMYDTKVCSVYKENDSVKGLVVENKDGRTLIGCGTVVDATGDADICHLAGEDTESLDSNVLSGWFYTLKDNGLTLHQISKHYSRYCTKEDADGPMFRGDVAEQVTQQLIGSRAFGRQRLAEIRAKDPGKDIQMVNPTTIPCFRMTRRLVGSFSLTRDQVHTWFDDAIGLTGDWREPGPVYAVPFRALRGEKNTNLITAGRCISSDTSVWDATRAIPTCAMTGQAAGTAAALAIGSENAFKDFDVSALQEKLKEQQALLDPGLVKPNS